jgi:hypothetical protein
MVAILIDVPPDGHALHPIAFIAVEYVPESHVTHTLYPVPDVYAPA